MTTYAIIALKRRSNYEVHCDWERTARPVSEVIATTRNILVRDQFASQRIFYAIVDQACLPENTVSLIFTCTAGERRAFFTQSAFSRAPESI